MRDIEGRNANIAAEVRDAARTGSPPLKVIEMDVTSTESVNLAVAGIVDAEKRIDVAAGERPCRVPIGMDFGLVALNTVTEPFRLGMLKGLGLERMEGVKAAGR